MRALPARRMASAVVTAALLVGITAPAAVAVDHASKRERIEAAAKAPVPGADALLGQVTSLGNLGTVLTPVTDLLNAVLKADNGQLTPEQATDLGGKVTEAIGKLTAAAPVPVPTTPVTPSTTTTPSATTAPTTPLPTGAVTGLLPTTKSDDSKAPSADAVADALAALQKAVTDLLAAATSGDPTKVVPAVQAVLTSLVSAIVAILLGGGLPLPLPVPVDTGAVTGTVGGLLPTS